MALFEKKQQLGGKPEKTPLPEDTSGFGGKPFITRQDGMFWVRKEGFQRTGLQPGEVAKHWNEVTKDAPNGYVTKPWAEQKLGKLQQQYSMTTDSQITSEIRKQIKVLKGFLGEK